MPSSIDPALNPTLANNTLPSPPIRILIVDDQNFVRMMLQESLQPIADFEVIDVATSGQEALTKIDRLRPDIALVDIEMPGMSGLDITRTICESHARTKVLVLSIHDEEDYIRNALKSGAKGYLLKNTPTEELAHAIRFVHLGYLQLGPGLFEKLEPESESLSTLPAPPEQVPTNFMLPDSPPPLAFPAESSLPSFDLDWSAATQETVNTLPRLWSRGIIYIMLVFTAVLLPWAAFSQIDEVGVAQGRLEPQGKTIRLDAPVAGTVSVLRVQEGQEISQGQPLLEMQSDVVTSDLQQAQVKLEGLLNRQTQLLGVKAQLENSLSTARQQAQAQTVSQQATIDKALMLQNSLQSSLTSLRRLLELDRAKIAKLKALSAQGAIPRTQWEDAERIMLQNQQQLEKALSELQQAQAEVLKQRKEYQRILSEGELSLIDKTKQIEELQSQIIDIQSQAGQAKALIQSLQYQRQQRVVVAPANGTLFQLNVQHPGAVLQPGQNIAQISPRQARLVLRARIDNRQTGFLRVGKPAKIKFDAYPFQDYGIQSGRLTWISPTSTQVPVPASDNTPSNDPSTPAPPSSFEVEIQLDRPDIVINNKAIALKAGQTATAEVIIRRRRVLDLFLEPFYKLSKDGLTL
jgi:hemolysin D